MKSLATLSVCVCLFAHGFWGRIPQKRLEIEVRSTGKPIGNGMRRIEWSHVTLKGQGGDPYMFNAHYIGNGWTLETQTR